MRLLLFVDAHLGHVSAAAGLVQRMTARGHEVHACCVDDRSARHFASFGIAATTMPELAGRAPDDGDRAARRAAVAERVGDLPRALARLDVPRHDLALIDPFLLWIYPLLAPMVPCVSLCTKPALVPGPLVPPWTTGIVPGPGLVRRTRVRGSWLRQWVRYGVYRADCGIRQAVLGASHRSLTLAALDHAGHAYRDLRSRPVPIDMRFLSVPELILHAREFDFPGAAGTRILHAGPCVAARRAGDGPAAPDPGPGAGPTVFCSLGTEGRAGDLADRYRAVLAALESLPDSPAIVSTSDPRLSAVLRDEAVDRSGRIAIVDWVNSQSVIDRADVVVNHGGANLTKEGLAAGRPVVAMPMRGDQPGIAARIAYHGVGVAVARPGAGAIRDAILRAATDSAIRQRAERMASAFARYDREHVAETTIERLCGAEGSMPADHERPYDTYCRAAAQSNGDGPGYMGRLRPRAK